DPKIDIWAVARPVLERILAERYSPRRLAREFRRRLPELVTKTPEMPRLVHAWLEQQVSGRHELQMRSNDLVALTGEIRTLQRRAVAAIAGAGLLVTAAVLYGLDAGGPVMAGAPVAAWATGLCGLAALIIAWRRG